MRAGWAGEAGKTTQCIILHVAVAADASVVTPSAGQNFAETLLPEVTDRSIQYFFPVDQAGPTLGPQDANRRAVRRCYRCRHKKLFVAFTGRATTHVARRADPGAGQPLLSVDYGVGVGELNQGQNVPGPAGAESRRLV